MTLTLRATSGYALAKPPAKATVRAISGYALVDPNPKAQLLPPVPTNYQTPQLEMLYDLIEKSNPGFKEQYPLGTVTFGQPTVVAVNKNDYYENDTSILVQPVSGKGFGSQTVRYRRIDVGVLFTGIAIALNDYSPQAGFLANATWKASFLAKYRLSLTTADLNSTNNMTAGVSFPVPILPSCLCYRGQFNMTWTQGKRSIREFITDANRALAIRAYPGGNDFTTPGRKPIGEFQLYVMDISTYGPLMNAFGSVFGSPFNTASQFNGSSSSSFDQIIAWLNANSGRTNWSKQSHTVEGGLSGLQWYTYNSSLPNAAIPEANSAKFNCCTVIQSLPTSWFSGKLILHYKV